MKGLLLKGIYVDAKEQKTREVKLIYCFNLLHCRLNKLKESFFSLKPLLAQGQKRLLVPPTWLKGKSVAVVVSRKGDSGKNKSQGEVMVVVHTGTSG